MNSNLFENSTENIDDRMAKQVGVFATDILHNRIDEIEHWQLELG